MNRRDAKNAMKMPLTMGALPDDIEQMRRIREERQSGITFKHEIHAR